MSPKPKIRSFSWVQGLRGAAAVMVAYHNSNFIHHELVGSNNRWLVGGLVGEVGVDLFFVLSGFLMVRTTLADPPGPAVAGRFLMSRASRIYPAYWVVAGVWAVVLAVWPAAGLGHPSAPMWRALALLPSDEAPQLTQAWSLIFEVYFYLVFGLMLMARRRRLLLAAWAVWLVGSVVAGLTLPGPIGALVSNPLSLEFLIGCAVALIPERRVPERWVPERRVAGSLLLAGAGLALMFAGEIGRAHFTLGHANLWRALLVGLPAGAVLLGAINFETRSGVTAPLWLTALGDRSFAIYLVNAPIAACLAVGLANVGFASRFGPLARDTTYVAATIILTFVLSEAVHRCVERPSMALSRSLRRRGHAPASAAKVREPTADPRAA
jgi:peptidoglycan/LPS O-acetylase OafA/YrhL